MREINDFVKYSNLFNYYRELFSEKQQEYMNAYFEEDNTLTEVATLFNVSRQAVFSNVNKACKQLDKYEEKLGLFKREMYIKDRLLKLIDNPTEEEIRKLLVDLEYD